MVCKMARYIRSSDGLKVTREIYTCYEVRKLMDSWKDEFRNNYLSSLMNLDIVYQAYCEDLDSFLSNCKCE